MSAMQGYGYLLVCALVAVGLIAGWTGARSVAEDGAPAAVVVLVFLVCAMFGGVVAVAMGMVLAALVQLWHW